MERTAARSFQDLVVWQRAHEFVLEVYRTTSVFPKSEIYGLTSQFRRAAVSVPANIAEGFKRKTLADKARFLNMAQGSLEECRYYLILASDLGYMEGADMMSRLGEVSKLLAGYLAAVTSSYR